MSAAQQEIAIDMLMKKGFLFSTDTESRKISEKPKITLKALRRLSFLVPIGDLLPESLLLFRKGIAMAVVSTHHIS